MFLAKWKISLEIYQHQNTEKFSLLLSFSPVEIEFFLISLTKFQCFFELINVWIKKFKKPRCLFWVTHSHIMMLMMTLWLISIRKKHFNLNSKNKQTYKMVITFAGWEKKRNERFLTDKPNKHIVLSFFYIHHHHHDDDIKKFSSIRISIFSPTLDIKITRKKIQIFSIWLSGYRNKSCFCFVLFKHLILFSVNNNDYSNEFCIVIHLLFCCLLLLFPLALC